ncbi:MAG: ligase-associated DNA damage response exonuclease [Fimbriimonadaceae bacterium]|nr:ligase-associated DNA damage response exonuclease [Fimbriimonadaceae bacterium]
MPSPDLLTLTERGLYCPAADVYIDPWRAVDRAIITHAHSDHARWGSRHYLCAAPGVEVLRLRLAGANVHGIDYGEVATVNGVRITLHPAGHILGSAQVRLEHRGEVAVVSGDYKTAPDTTCATFEPVPCHTFVTESTFGLPIYRWRPDAEIFAEINDWWAENQRLGVASLLMGYALGKAQRALSGLNPELGPIVLHGSMTSLTEAYRHAGIALPPTRTVSEMPRDTDWSQVLILAPPSAQGTPWTRRFGDHRTAFMSGWMAIRGTRRRRAIDRGFVLSDHVDWPSLMTAIDATGAETVWVTHGYSNVVVRHLRDQGRDAHVLETQFEGESGQDDPEASEAVSE